MRLAAPLPPAIRRHAVRFGRRSSLRSPVAPLLALAAVLVLVAAACTSSTSGAKVELAGQRFTIVSDESWFEPVASVEEMERVAGFPFIFPSYLPEGLGDKMKLSAWAGGEATVGGVPIKDDPNESVLIYSKRPDAPSIAITERKPLSPEAYPEPSYGLEAHTIGGTDVSCYVQNSPGEVNTPFAELVFLCEWVIEDRGFQVGFSWTGESSTPGYIAEDMRQEALKVIQSMIEAPVQIESPEPPQ